MENWKKQVPLQLTLSRVYILPFILGFLYFNAFYYSLVASLLFIAAFIVVY